MKKRLLSKKILIIATLSISGLLLSSNTLADTQNSGQNPTASILIALEQAMQSVSKSVQNLTTIVKQWYLSYQGTAPEQNSNIKNITQNNTVDLSKVTTTNRYIAKPDTSTANITTPPAIPQNTSISELSGLYAQLLTENSISNYLSQYNFSAQYRQSSPGMTNPADKINARTIDLSSQQINQTSQNNTPTYLTSIQETTSPLKYYREDNSLEALSGVKTSGKYAGRDSLYLPQDKLSQNSNAILNTGGTDPTKSIDYKSYLEKPSQPNDAMLNFGSLITPKSYSGNQLQNSQNFVKYAAQNTINPFPESTKDNPAKTGGLYDAGLDLSNIYSLQSPQLGQALYDLKTSAEYQRFKFNLRSILALKSTSINALNKLIAERTPVKGLGTMHGVKNADGQPVANASPLQVQAYMAEHRIKDKNWYKEIQSASVPTLQQKTLIVLAEIEAQNFQTHLDNEQILAQLAALNLTNQQQQMDALILKDNVKLQEKIKTITKKFASS